MINHRLSGIAVSAVLHLRENGTRATGLAFRKGLN
jgi:hypothetical protein